ncbi:MAG: alcohol dehydrogenase catalytic domain-containing protein [Planctomycetota bacterium]
MRGLEIRSGQVAYRGDLPPPASLVAGATDECRVRVTRAGVCATDLALARGYMGFAGVPGHEFVGVALDGPLAGSRVVGEINAACGRCEACRGGLDRHCPERTVLGILGRPGAFAEELTLPARNLHAVPEGVSDDEAVFAEPLAAAFEIPTQVDLAGAERAAVVGDGRLGLLCAQVVALGGVDVDLFGRHPERGEALPAAIQHRGALPGTPPAPGGRYDLVVEATGDPRVLGQVLGFVRPRGILVLKTTTEAPASLDLAPLVVDEITLLGSRCGPFAPALDAMAAGSVVLTPWIHARFPLEEGPRAFARAAEPGTLKVLLDIQAS